MQGWGETPSLLGAVLWATTWLEKITANKWLTLPTYGVEVLFFFFPLQLPNQFESIH